MVIKTLHDQFQFVKHHVAKKLSSKNLTSKNNKAGGRGCLTLLIPSKAIHVIQHDLSILTFRLLFKSVLATEVSITLGPAKHLKIKTIILK